MKTTKKYFGLLALVLLMSTSLNASTGKLAPSRNCLQYAFDIGAEMYWAGGFSPREIANMTYIHYQVCSGIL